MICREASIATQLAGLDEADRETLIDSLSPEAAEAILKDWRVWARPEQLTPPGDWSIWLVMAGRGWGKTLTGAEDVKRFGLDNPGSRIAIVAPTYADARDTCVEGESGLLSRIDSEDVATWNRSLGELVLVNGTRYKLFSSDQPDRLRGPQNHRAWCDELAAWRYQQETFDMLLLGLRLGLNPQVVITTTPRPTGLLRGLIGRAGRDVYLTRGSTFENRENLAPAFFSQVVARYQGSRLSRQELYAELLEDVPGALWDIDLLESCHLFTDPAGVALARVVVAIDPAATSAEGSSETGIVVAARGTDGRGYVLEDVSLRGSPEQWARAAVAAFDTWQADLIVGEVNNGGEMIEAVLRTVRRSIPYKAVRASRGKQTRAEPIAALYRQGKVSHMGVFALLESQMCSWVPGMPSPDRMDALVWTFSELLVPGDSGHGPVFLGGARAPLRPGRVGR